MDLSGFVAHRITYHVDRLSYWTDQVWCCDAIDQLIDNQHVVLAQQFWLSPCVISSGPTTCQTPSVRKPTATVEAAALKTRGPGASSAPQPTSDHQRTITGLQCATPSVMRREEKFILADRNLKPILQFLLSFTVSSNKTCKTRNQTWNSKCREWWGRGLCSVVLEYRQPPYMLKILSLNSFFEFDSNIMIIFYICDFCLSWATFQKKLVTLMTSFF